MDYRVISIHQVVSAGRKYGHSSLNIPASTGYKQAGSMWEHAAEQVGHRPLTLQR